MTSYQSCHATQSCACWSVRCHLNTPQRWLLQESSLSHTRTAVSISVTPRKHYGRHVCKFISHFHLFSLSFQCHMQNRPAAADAGLSVGAINTHRRCTKYRPHLVAYRTAAHNAKTCGEKFTAWVQKHKHTHRQRNMRACAVGTHFLRTGQNSELWNCLLFNLWIVFWSDLDLKG